MADEDRFDAASNGTRRTRWRGLVGFSIVRAWKRATKTRSGRFVATVAAVALTVALLVVVTGIALALAGGGVADDTDADARIVPEDSGTLSTINGVEDPRLGETADRSAAMRSHDGVEHASPMLVEPVELESADGGESRRILLVGVVPDDEPRRVGGLSTAELDSAAENDPSAGDERNASVEERSNATAEAPPSRLYGSAEREIVLSSAAAEQLGAEAGDELAVGDAHLPDGAPAPRVTVIAVEEPAEDDGTPVALVHYDDLRLLAGSDEGQLADGVLVWGEPETAAAVGAAEYPDASIESDESTDPDALFGDGLAFATSLLALVVGVAICASFVATTAAMTVNDDRRMLAVLASVGFPTYSRLTVVAASTLVTTLCGALVGVGLGALGITAVNELAGATVAPGTVAQFHPLFVPYAVVVALVSGLIAVPYPLVVAARTSVLEEVGR